MNQFLAVVLNITQENLKTEDGTFPMLQTAGKQEGFSIGGTATPGFKLMR